MSHGKLDNQVYSSEGRSRDTDLRTPGKEIVFEVTDKRLVG